jgi:signal transduction histidine kinase
LNLKLGQARRDLANDPNAERVLSGLQDEAGQALAELRDLAHGIYPQVLTSDGLSGALAEAARHAAIPATFTGDGVGRFAPEIEAAVYFCCLEALQNASKYAGDGASVQVKLSETDGELRFEVADDGAGFDPASANGSAGLQNMADRIGALGGELRIVSRSGAGTSVAGTIPVVG